MRTLDKTSPAQPSCRTAGRQQPTDTPMRVASACEGQAGQSQPLQFF